MNDNCSTNRASNREQPRHARLRARPGWSQEAQEVHGSVSDGDGALDLSAPMRPLSVEVDLVGGADRCHR